MTGDSRWAREAYPTDYRGDVDQAIRFSGMGAEAFLKGKADHLVELLDRFGPGASRAACLDIGCGVGALHPALAGRLGRLEGVDVSEEALRAAGAANPGVAYRLSSGGRLPFEDGAFDLCFTVCVMHHVPPDQWPAFVAEAWRVTRPGGIFAVYEHNPLNPLTRLAVFRCPFDHDAVLLGPRRVTGLLRGQGFRPLRRDYLFFVPLAARWARGVDRTLRWLPAGAQYVVAGRRPGVAGEGA